MKVYVAYEIQDYEIRQVSVYSSMQRAIHICGGKIIQRYSEKYVKSEISKSYFRVKRYDGDVDDVCYDIVETEVE
jgi:hypothetical protein